MVWPAEGDVPPQKRGGHPGTGRKVRSRSLAQFWNPGEGRLMTSKGFLTTKLNLEEIELRGDTRGSGCGGGLRDRSVVVGGFKSS